MISDKDTFRFTKETDEHRAIVEVLIEGDARQASRAVTRHIRAGMK